MLKLRRIGLLEYISQGSFLGCWFGWLQDGMRAYAVQRHRFDGGQVGVDGILWKGEL
jgi:hypothetical protein